MKVAIIPSSVEPVGVATHTLNLACLLKKIGILDTVICPSEGWLTEQLRNESLPYHVLNISCKPWRFLSSNLKLFWFLKSRKSLKVVHVHGRFPLFVSLLSMILLKRRLKFVVTVHQFLASGKPGLFGWRHYLESIIWRHLIAKICCVSESLSKEVIRRIGAQHANKVVVIKNWIRPVNYAQKVKLKTDIDKKGNEIRLVAVGRLSPEKGFDVLIEAIHILVKNGVNIKCDIFGDGPEKTRLFSMISKYSLNDHVQLRGTQANVRRLLSKYHILVVPSRIESFGIVVLEAYDAGIPVIVSNIPGLTEVVENGKTGLLFESDNPESLVQQIMALANSPELANSFVNQGKKLLKLYFPSNELIKQFKAFYSSQDAES